MRIFILVFIAFVVGCGSEPAMTVEEWEAEQDQLEQIIDEGFYDSAIELATKRIKIAENFEFSKGRRSNAYNDLGSIYEEMGHFPEAYEALNKAIAFDSLNGVAHYNLGLLYNDFGRYLEAIESFGHAIEIYSQNLDVHDTSDLVNAGMAMAMSLVNSGEREESKKLIDIAIDHFGDKGDSSRYYSALKLRATHNILIGNTGDALRILQEIRPYYQRSKSALRYAELLNDIGSAFYFLQQYDSAKIYFATSIEAKLSKYQDSTMIRVPLTNLASAYEQLGNERTAQELMALVESIKADNNH